VSAPPLTPLAAAVLHVGVPERILQLECGEGDAALFLAREFPSARVRGVDRSAEAVQRSTDRVGLDPEGRIAFKQGKPGALPFPGDHFDLLAAVDARPSASEAARVLRRGCFLVVAQTSPKDAFSGLGGLLARRRLARSGFELVCAQPAGDGSFSVFRLHGGN
jgi:ubiquinone/menaquinone biosynthesis C-methylase UbiE